MSIEWNSIRLGGPTYGILNKTIRRTMPGVVQIGGLGVVGVKGLGCGGSDIRTKVKSLKFDIAERTNIFVENHRK